MRSWKENATQGTRRNNICEDVNPTTYTKHHVSIKAYKATLEGLTRFAFPRPHESTTKVIRNFIRGSLET